MASARAALFDNCTCRIGKHLSTAGIGAGGQRRLSGVFHEVVEPEAGALFERLIQENRFSARAVHGVAEAEAYPGPQYRSSQHRRFLVFLDPRLPSLHRSDGQGGELAGLGPEFYRGRRDGPSGDFN